jgi:hypothetical protein
MPQDIPSDHNGGYRSGLEINFWLQACTGVHTISSDPSSKMVAFSNISCNASL